MNIRHKKVVSTFYSIVIPSTNRAMPERLNEFLSGFDIDDEELWQDSHSILRDYEGDFEGIEIYYSEDLEDLYAYIASKLGIEFSEIEHLNIKITNI